MTILIFLIISVFIGSLINATFGFGFSLFCMSVLSLQFELKLISPLIPLLFISGSTYILYKDFKSIRFNSIIPLFMTAVVAAPIGVVALQYVDEASLKLFLGFLIGAFSIYGILSPNLPTLKNKLYSYLFGFFAGLLGGAFNIAGPPVVLYASMKGWSPAVFRATLQAFFWMLTWIIIGSHFYFNAYQQPDIFYYYLVSVSSMFLAIPIGKKINSSIKDKNKFNKYVYIIMLISGMLLILKSVS